MEQEYEEVMKDSQKFRARPAPPAHSPGGGRRVGATAGRGRDFVGENIRDATRVKRQEDEAQPDGREFLTKETYGQVPMYLQERKIELAAEKALKAAEAEAEAVPPGMRVIGEQERLETLQLLAEDRDKVESELRRMPFVVETPSLIRHKAALEGRLKEIDEAVRMFSRTRVLVRAF